MLTVSCAPLCWPLSKAASAGVAERGDGENLLTRTGKNPGSTAMAACHPAQNWVATCFNSTGSSHGERERERHPNTTHTSSSKH